MTTSPSVSSVHRLTWRQCVYGALAACWLLTLAHFLVAGVTHPGWWAVLLYGWPGLVGIDYGVSSGMLDIEEEPQPPTEWACAICGDLRPLSALIECDGLICRTHLTDGTSLSQPEVA